MRALLAWLVLGGGFTAEKHPELGLSFPRPPGYEQIPTQPDERWTVLYYAEAVPEDPAERRAVRPELRVVRIDAANPMDGVRDVESYVARKLSAWELAPGDLSARRGGFEGSEHALLPVDGRQGEEDQARAGWAWAWRGEERTFALVGFCAKDDLEEQQELWRTAARQMRIEAPRTVSHAALERVYARGTFLDPEFRIQVRKGLVQGWQAKDTRNYIVIYDTPDAALVRRVCRDIELLRKEYVERFPPAEELKAVSTVRICKSRDEYMQYGGIEDTAGYWNAKTKELVLFDMQREDEGRADAKSGTFLVLYHEAFHQYVFYSAGQLPPHSWFDEGHGDFFAGAEVAGGRVRSIGVNPWRLPTIQAAVQKRAWIPWKDILRRDQSAFYAEGPLCYSQAWSMVYFLRSSGEVARRRDWSEILPRYFDTLKTAFAEELDALAARSEPIQVQTYVAACGRSRTRALDTAFEGIDLAELETAWAAFVEALEPAPE